MKNIYTVKQVNSYIKNMFTQDFMLNRISVKGEVSNCKYHTSGHIYFSLKDESGTIACIMFAGYRSGLSFRLQEGQQIIVTGSVNVFERTGQYQLYAKEIRQEGLGELYEKFEALKLRLSEMGMFASEYKRPIPRYIHTLGIVTAPTGAAVRDIINIAGRRNPYVQLVLYPAQVQGEGAAESIVKGIHALEHYGVDVMIVGRGGGSIEDLWAFNEEIVARAIFESSIPVISAVGHETDTTIADYAADLRAPTPSAAAELAVYDIREVYEKMQGMRSRLIKWMGIRISDARNRAERLKLRIGYAHPQQKLNDSRQLSAELETRFRTAMQKCLETNRHRLAIGAERLNGLSPLKKLSQGYSYVRSESGDTVKSISQVSRGMKLNIFVKDGWYKAEVTDGGISAVPGYKEE